MSNILNRHLIENRWFHFFFVNILNITKFDSIVLITAHVYIPIYKILCVFQTFLLPEKLTYYTKYSCIAFSEKCFASK